jgi:predicted dinucleotide-binding enzyme
VRIATIGAGAMAEALGAGWAEAGHEVLVTARSPRRAAGLAARLGERAKAGGLREAAAFGEVVLLAVPGEAAAEALTAAGAADGVFAGRPLIDCTNAFVADAFTAAPGSFTLAVDAVSEQVAKTAKGAHVVKAFSMLAAEIWHGGERSHEARPLTVPLCGDDPDALAMVAGLVRDLGFHPVGAGGLDRARYVEAMTIFVMGLWFAGHDARATLPPLESAFAHPD